MERLRIAGTVNDSVVDGEGWRYAIFTQGCPHHCPGCHNPATHAFDGGRVVDTETLLQEILANPLLAGVTFSGGEPFLQPTPLAELGKAVHAHGLDVWAYTGYVYEDLRAKAENEPAVQALLDVVDILCDGPYIEAQRDLALPFRGSRNQRLIDIPQTRATGTIILHEI